MRTAVLKCFPTFTARFEGYLRYMYLDVKGLVTTGRGNLLTPDVAVMLPWKTEDGILATHAQILEEYQMVELRRDLDQKGGGAYGSIATLFLDDSAVDTLTNSKCLNMECILKQRFPYWEQWPACSQLATLSLSWACGPRFHFPKFEVAAHSQDWLGCAAECSINYVW